MPLRRSAKPTTQRWRKVLIALPCVAIAWLLLAWAAAHCLIVRSELPAADAIVILSGSATYIERADWAARLFRAGRAPMVIVTDEKLISGWSNAEQRNPFFYELSIRELQRRDVPLANTAVIHDTGAGTFQQCARIRDYAIEHRLKRVLIVTSSYHSRRAFWSMQQAAAGKDLVIGIDSPPPGWQMPPPATWWMSRLGWKTVAGEYVKIVYYRLSY